MKTETCLAVNTEELANRRESISMTYRFDTIISIVRTSEFSYDKDVSGMRADYVITYTTK